MFLRDRPSRSPARARGITLIEVLITVLVLAAGLLGLSALQTLALQSSQMASQRTMATTLATRVADEYRAYRSLPRPPQAVRDAWAAEAARALPNGSLVHDRNGDVITITVTWRDDREDAAVGDDQLSFSTRL